MSVAGDANIIALAKVAREEELEEEEQKEAKKDDGEQLTL